MIRVVLVDPSDESRPAIERLLSGMGTIWLVESCTAYATAAAVVAENAPDLTIVVLDSDPEAALGLIGAVRRAKPDAVILPASATRDSDLILRVVRSGAREFLTLPADLDEILGALGRLVPADPGAGHDASRRGARVIAVTGAAGGVGCTSLAVNLATALAKDPEESVVVADFDMLLGSVDACLDIIPDRTVFDVAQNVDRLDLTLLRRSLTRHASGLHVLPRPAQIEDVARVEPEALRRVVGLLKAAFSLVVIDASKALQAADVIAFEAADTILVVIQLELTCLRNTARLLQLFRQYEGVIDRVKIVVNREGAREAEISVKKAEETLNMPVSWQVPNAPREFAAARSRGVTIEAQAPGSRAHRALADLAAEFARAADKVAEPAARSRLGRFAASIF